MLLDTSRILSDRLIYDEAAPGKLRITNSFWDWIQRIIAWIWSPGSYSDENRRTVHCFKNYLVDTLGPERLRRICTRYSIDFEQMESQGSPLLSRDVAKIVIGARDARAEDINDYLVKNQAQFPDKQTFKDLTAQELSQIQGLICRPFEWIVSDLAVKLISGRPTEWLACLFYDPFLADRERLQLCKENANDLFDTFLNHLSARVIKREMDVGMLIPAPVNRNTGASQFYYVAAKIVTGEGMVSYIIHPATNDTDLEGVRLFRGTSARNSDIDGISSLITDLEKDLGRTAYESGIPYEASLQEKIDIPTVEAGHSLGATIVQYRLANMDHIRKAYVYSGPGVPLSEVEKFNRKQIPVQLFIRHAAKDGLSSLGQAHLGHNAPPHVHVEYWKYHSRLQDLGEHPHVVVWGRRERTHYGIEGGMRAEHRNEALFHKNKSKECLRALFGPPIAAMLRAVRDVSRACFSCRAHRERGAQIGRVFQGRWQVEHIRV